MWLLATGRAWHHLRGDLPTSPEAILLYDSHVEYVIPIGNAI